MGADILGQSIATKMIVDPILGYNFVGFLADERPEEITFYLRDRMNILGQVNDYEELIKKHAIRSVFLALPRLDNSKVIDIATYCSMHNISFQAVPNLFELMASSVDVSELDGIPLIAFKSSPLNLFNSILKRSFDVLTSLAGLIVFSPIFLLVAIAVKITSAGPVFYMQERTGLNGRPFKFIKFRSMRVDAE
ncbi:MAG: sugar transferase, partial [Candidatus Margulisiibacteriota bacterium]